MHLSWLGPELLVCCLAHLGPTDVFLLLRILGAHGSPSSISLLNQCLRFRFTMVVILNYWSVAPKYLRTMIKFGHLICIHQTTSSILNFYQVIGYPVVLTKCACSCFPSARFVSYLFGNHIVDFPTRRLNLAGRICEMIVHFLIKA